MKAAYQDPPQGYKVIDQKLWQDYLTFTHIDTSQFKQNFDKTVPHVLRMRGIERIDDGGSKHG